jgi:hypothetical protein
MVNKNTIKKLYNEYKKQYINELFDSPLLFKKDSNTKYIVYDVNNNELAYFLFTFMYNIKDSSIDYKKYNLTRYWDISWYWSNNISNNEKNTNNFIKVISTSFKIVDDFIRNYDYPPLLGFGGLSEKHENIYSNKLFLDRWKILFNEKYYVEWKNDKLWLINKNFHQIDEHRLVKHSNYQEKPISEIYRDLKFPNKNKTTGIYKFNLIKEQTKRVILKQIYLK